MATVRASPIIIKHTRSLITSRICTGNHLVKMLKSRKSPQLNKVLRGNVAGELNFFLAKPSQLELEYHDGSSRQSNNH